MKRAALALAALALIVPSSASAAHHPQPPITRATQIAAAYWGVEQTCPAESVAITWTPDLGTNEDTGDSTGGRAYVGGCASGQRTIWLNSSVNVGFAVRCTTVVHEYGHLIGLGHDTGDGVMNPWYSAFHPVPACVTAQKHWRRKHWRSA